MKKDFISTELSADGSTIAGVSLPSFDMTHIITGVIGLGAGVYVGGKFGVNRLLTGAVGAIAGFFAGNLLPSATAPIASSTPMAAQSSMTNPSPTKSAQAGTPQGTLSSFAEGEMDDDSNFSGGRGANLMGDLNFTAKKSVNVCPVCKTGPGCTQTINTASCKTMRSPQLNADSSCPVCYKGENCNTPIDTPACNKQRAREGTGFSANKNITSQRASKTRYNADGFHNAPPLPISKV